MARCLLSVAVVAVVILQLCAQHAQAEPNFYSARYGKRPDTQGNGITLLYVLHTTSFI